MKRILTLIVLCCLPAAVATAKEGADSYPNGAENWMLGNVPGPGTYHLNYLIYYSGELRDGSGDKVNLGGTTPSVSAVAEAARFLLVTNTKILGGNYAVHVIVPVIYQNVDMGGKKSASGIGDLSLVPFALTFHGKTVHQYVYFETDARTGHFNPTDPRVSIGSGAWSIIPAYGMSVLPHSGWDLSGKFHYDVHLKDPADDYRSGQEFHADYLAGRHFGPWGLAAAGYVVKQFTDDRSNGVSVPAVPGLYSAGRRGQAFSIGPSAMYMNKSHMIFIAQYMHEAFVENRFGGDKVLVRFIMPCSLLQKKK